MTLTSRQLNATATDIDTNTETLELTSQVNVGKYRLTLTTTEFGNLDTFKETYWGHRATYDYAEITQADTQTSVAVTHEDGTEITAGETIEKTDKLKFSVTVTPHHGNEASEGVEAHAAEAKTCAAPTETVQLYLKLAGGTEVALGEALALTAESGVDSSGYAYSTAELTTDLSKYTLTQLTGATVIARYSGERNYTTSDSSAANLPAITSYVLPETGGSGTAPVYALGCSLTLAATALLLRRRNRETTLRP